MTPEEGYQAVRAAVTEWFAADQDGATVEAFVLMAVGRTIDDAMMDPSVGARTRHSWCVNEGQQVYVSLGVAHQLVDAVQVTEEDDE